MPAQFHKYQALGNDMVVLDPATFEMPLTPAAIRLICDRHVGLGADGICYGPLPGVDQPLTMRFFNPDGSESAKSGNGLRIFARYLWDQGYVGQDQPEFEIGIGAERARVTVAAAGARRLAVTMGQLSFDSRRIPVAGIEGEVVEAELVVGNERHRVTAVTVGNPHCVLFSETVSKAAVSTLGPALETVSYFPARTNVQLAQVVDRHTLRIEIWERGAGYTLASGSSACAAAGAAIKTGRCASPVTVRMAGGSAEVTIDAAWKATLTGDVAAVCAGAFAAEFVEQFAKLFGI